jgi:hypothetical protein
MGNFAIRSFVGAVAAASAAIGDPFELGVDSFAESFFAQPTVTNDQAIRRTSIPARARKQSVCDRRFITTSFPCS